MEVKYKKPADRQRALFNKKSNAVEIVDAFAADELTFILHQTLSRGAKYAVVLVFAEDDLLIFDKDLHLIMLCNIQRSSQFDGKDDSAQLIDLSNNTCRFHNQLNPFHLCVFLL